MREPLLQPCQLGAAQKAVGPVEIRRDPARRLQPQHRNTAELDKGLECVADIFLVERIGVHQPGQKVQLRHVVVAGHGKNRGTDLVHEGASSLELVLGAVLGEVTTDHDEVWGLRRELRDQGVDDGLIVPPEMQVR